MKKHILFFLIFISLTSLAQIAPDYYAITFTDKNDNPYSLDAPQEFLTQRSIDRRTRYDIEYHISDLPITPTYVEQVSAVGVTVFSRVKWINTILIKTTDASLLDEIMALPFVESYTKLPNENSATTSNFKTFLELEAALVVNEKPVRNTNKSAYELTYGAALEQIELINGVPIHEAGFKGQGMVISVLDGGFQGVDERIIFDSLWDNGRILGARDFASEENNPFSGSTHGTKVLSTMGAYWPNEMIGTAPEASYWLLRTEFTDYEYIIEEYNWLVGAAFADSVGTDLINSSLGYNVFDDPAMDHDWDDLDGNTTIVTNGADLAAKKGILVVNSAGNSGGSSWEYITCPADGDSVFTIGAVNYNADIAYFSSRGLPSDPRVKPNVCAVGSGTVVADPYYDGISSSSGTSFSSPTIAGMTACLWQANIELNNKQIMELIESSSSQFNNPDIDYGYGIPNYEVANNMVGIIQTEKEIKRIKYYPNPVNLMLTIEGVSSSEVEIYDLNGALLGVYKMVSNQIDVSHLKPGAYIARVMTIDDLQSFGFIKQ